MRDPLSTGTKALAPDRGTGAFGGVVPYPHLYFIHTFLIHSTDGKVVNYKNSRCVGPNEEKERAPTAKRRLRKPDPTKIENVAWIGHNDKIGVDVCY